VSTSLLESIGKLPRVTSAAALEFADSRQSIIAGVNSGMEARSDIGSLTGGSQVSTMRANHSNHVNTMVNVFMLENYGILAMTAPWVYRTYISHGFSPDYFPVLFDAFREAVRGVLSPDSAASIIPVYDWLLENHKHILSCKDLADDIAGDLDPSRESERIAFRNALLAGDHKSCLAMSRLAVADIRDLSSFYLQILQPCMYEIGRMWERGDISVAEEHLASAVAGRVMASLYGGIAASERSKGLCVVTAAPNEQHEIGARMVADLLEQDGWDVRFLGSNIEIQGVLSFVRENSPFIVAVSAALPFTIEGVGKIVSALKSDPSTAVVKIMIGGLAFSRFPELWKNLGADGFASNAADAVRLAEKWRREGDRRRVG